MNILLKVYIANIKKRFSAGSFAYHTTTLMSGTLIAQLVGFAALIILTRIYTVAQFGEYAMYLAIAGFGTVIATGRYEMAIMLPKDSEDAVSLVLLSALVAICLSIFSLFIIISSNFVFQQLLLWNAFPLWAYLIPLTILLAGIHQALSYWLSRNKQYSALSQGRIAQAIATALISILLGYVYGAGSLGLIYGSIFGQFIAVLLFAWIVKHSCTFAIKGVSHSRIRLNAVRYKDFPIVNTMHVAIDTTQSSVVPIAIDMIFGKISLGYYAFALRFIDMPIRLVGSAAAQIFFQRASNKFSSKEKIYPLISKLQTYLAVTTVPIFLTLMAIAPLLFKYLFGVEWVMAGEVVRILCPWLCINVFVSMISHLPVILGKQKEALSLNITEKFVLMGSLAIGWVYMLDMLTTLMALSLFMSIYAIFMLMWMNRIAIKGDMENVVKGSI